MVPGPVSANPALLHTHTMKDSDVLFDSHRTDAENQVFSWGFSHVYTWVDPPSVTG